MATIDDMQNRAFMEGIIEGREEAEERYKSEVIRFHEHSNQLVAKFMADHGFLTGTAESIPDLLGELSKQIFELRQGAK